MLIKNFIYTVCSQKNAFEKSLFYNFHQEKRFFNLKKVYSKKLSYLELCSFVWVLPGRKSRKQASL